MWRSTLIVGAVGMLMATGIALASPTGSTRLPVTLTETAADRPTTEGNEAVVERGDHLWKISARHLDMKSSELEIAPYWVRVIDANMPTLRSGNPDLIYPGEVIRLPEINERP